QQFAGGGDQCVELLRRALALWRAAPARTKSRSFGTCRIDMEADVVAAWPPGRAARPAVDAGAAHGEDEAPVERLVAFADGQPAAFLVEHWLSASGRDLLTIVGCLRRRANPHCTFKPRARSVVCRCGHKSSPAPLMRGRQQ